MTSRQGASEGDSNHTSSARELLKKLAFRYTNLGKPKFEYNLEPIQLAEIVNGIETAYASNGANGAIVEIGVARGMTSKFIAEHITRQKYDLRFYCIDTFSSFTQDDLDYEVETRGKSKRELIGFEYNDYEVWKRNFEEYPFLTAIQSDASEFDFSTIAPIQFCLLDVDLYLPTLNVLNNIREHLADDAVIVVDDVMDNNQWDGAYQAFFEFVTANKLDHRIVGNKCGVLRISK